MISSIRLDGTTAAMTIAVAADSEVFRTYAGELLCPELRQGDIVVMDNLAVHKSPATLALIQAAGAEVRFLPAYSPDLNPIEKMWSKIKAAPACGHQRYAAPSHRQRCSWLVQLMRLC